MKTLSKAAMVCLVPVFWGHGCYSPDAATECVRPGDCDRYGATCDNGVCVPGDTDGIVPDPPIIDGEPSSGHAGPTWTWNRPAGAAYLEYNVNGEGWVQTDALSYTGDFESEGDVAFEVRACNRREECATRAFTTRIEFLETYPDTNTLVWNEIAKADLAVTPNNNAVAVNCHNCYVYEDTDAPVKATNELIDNAVSWDVDLIGLDLVMTDDRLIINYQDETEANGRPPLSDLFSNKTLKNAEALLFLEFKEDDELNNPNDDPDVLAKMLLNELDRHRDYVRNGRPLFVRAFTGIPEDRMAYLSGIHERVDAYPMIAHYVRFSAIVTDMAPTVSIVRSLKASYDFLDMIEIYYGAGDVLDIIETAHEEGIAVALWDVPRSGWDGEKIKAADLLIVDVGSTDNVVRRLKEAIRSED